MLARCNNPKEKAYRFYGARGISVCERWNVFENFLADMGERVNKDLTIDRINPFGNYEPSNCRWATKQEQSRNRRNNVLNVPTVIEIKRLRAKGISTANIAEQFSLRVAAVRDVVSGRTWGGIS